MDNRKQNRAGHDSSLRRLKEITLEVIAHRHKVPARVLNAVFASFKVGLPGIHIDAELRRVIPEGIDGTRRSIDCSHVPTVCGEPQRISTGSACQVKSFARLQPLRSLD